MRFISTKVHAIMDYVVGIILIAAPWLLNFNQGGAETYVPVIIGAGTIVMSLFTDYELSLSRRIPLSVHLTIDFIAGLTLAVSPWLFGFHEYVYLPHLIIGIIEIGASLFTQTSPVHKFRTT